MSVTGEIPHGWPGELIGPQLEGWVEEAAIVLDSHVPDWATRIDESEIRMGSCFNCIFGQIYAENPLEKPGYVYAFNYLPWTNPLLVGDRGIIFAAVEAKPFWINEIQKRL